MAQKKRCNSFTYGFNGMEKDDEMKGAGNSYDFGARMLDVRIGRWLSKDPLAVNFPFSSPFAFGSDNPIINIDPDGKADIYFNGKWIGTDNVDDGLLVIASNKKVKKEVKKAMKENGVFPEIGLKNGQVNDNFSAIHSDVLEESLNVLKLAHSTSEDLREHTAVLDQVGDGFETINRNSPPEDIQKDENGTPIGALGGTMVPGDVSIHSHSFWIEDQADGNVLFGRAERPSPADENGDGDLPMFKHYEVNIIVGPTGFPERSSTGSVLPRPGGIVVFDSNAKEQFRIPEGNATKMKDSEQNKKNKNGG